MLLGVSLCDHYFDAGRCLDDGVCAVNGEAQFSGHRELVAGDVVEVFLEYLPDVRIAWTIE